jgi:hypothetical protein
LHKRNASRQVFWPAWTLSDGVTTVDEELVPALDGNLYNRLDPKDSFT